MANAFNLTAQLNLRGPANIKPVVDQIRKQLGSINANVNVTIASSATRNVAALTASLNKLNTSLGQTTTNASSAANAISKLSSAIRGADASKLGASLTAAANASNKLAKQQQITQKNLSASRTEMEEFGKQAALAIRRFAAFSTVTAIVYQLNNAISSGLQSFVAFDKEFVKLQQVTGESARNLSELRNEITRLSTGLGVTSQELTQVSSTLAQAGLNARETRQALEALALSALAPSFDNLNDTVEGSIALMRQFGISSTELGSALGSVNAVAAAFAVEAGDIIKAIQRTGGVFANASKGVTEGTDALNEFISVFTSVRQTTRESAETIATGLRTIFTRIQRGSTIQALKEYGVQLTDLEGKFVGPYKAVQLLSEGLGRIDPRDLRFSQIVEELGGFRQIGKVIPLIQQFSVAQRALAVAQEGQSSLAEDAAIAQLSLANQISKVREEFLSLFREIGSSDTFQFVTKGALSLTSGLIRLTDSLKNVLPVFAIITAAKGLSAITQFGAGFGKGIRRGGGQQNVPAVAGFAKGGLVPGSGNTDSVPAMLTPGEFVVNKKAVSKYGRGNLVRMNKYAQGGPMLVKTAASAPGGRGQDGIASYYDDNLVAKDKIKGNIDRKTISKKEVEAFYKAKNTQLDPNTHKEFAQDIRLASQLRSRKKNTSDDRSKLPFTFAKGFAFEDFIGEYLKVVENKQGYTKSTGQYDPIDFTGGGDPIEVRFRNKKTSNATILAKRLRYNLNTQKPSMLGFTPQIDDNPAVDVGRSIIYEVDPEYKKALRLKSGGLIQKFMSGSAGGVKPKPEPFGTGATKFPRRISNAYAKQREKEETALRFDKLIQKSPINERIMVDEAMEQQIAQGMRQPLDREQFAASFRRAVLRDEIASNISNFAKLVGLPQEDLSVVLPRQLDFGSGSGPIGSRGGRDVLGGAFTTISPYGSRGAEGWDLSEFGYTKQDEQDLFGFEKLLEEKQKERAKIRKTPTRTFDDGSTSFDLQAYDKASDEYNALNKQIYDIRTKRDAAISAANKAREEEVASSGRATLGFGTRFGKAQNPVFYHELTHQLFKGLRAKSADSFDKYKQRVTTLFETDNDGLADAFDALNAGYSSADVVYGRAYKLDLLGYKQREEIRKDPAAEEAKNLSSLIKSGTDAKKATQFRPINPSFNEAMLKFYSQEHLDKVEDNGKEEFLTTLVEKMPVLDQRLQGILDSTMTELLGGAGIQRQTYKEGSIGGVKSKTAKTISGVLFSALQNNKPKTDFADAHSSVGKVLGVSNVSKLLAEIEKSYGVTSARFLDSGGENVVFDIGNEILKISRTGFGIQQIAKDIGFKKKQVAEIGNYQLPTGLEHVSGYRNVKTFGKLTAALQDKVTIDDTEKGVRDAELLQGKLAERGLHWIDAGAVNMGYDKKGMPTVIDGMVLSKEYMDKYLSEDNIEDIEGDSFGPMWEWERDIKKRKGKPRFNLGGMARFLDGGWVERMKKQPKSVLESALQKIQSAAMFADDTGAYVPSFNKTGSLSEAVSAKELKERFQALSMFLTGQDPLAGRAGSGRKKQSKVALKDADGYNQQELLDAVLYYQGGSGPLARAMVKQKASFIDRDEQYSTDDVVSRLKASAQYKAPKKLYSGLGRGQYREILKDAKIHESDLVNNPDQALAKLQGQTIDFPTFLSTSTLQKVAKTFIGDPGAFMSIDARQSEQKVLDILKAKKTSTKDVTEKGSRRLPGIDKLSDVKLSGYDLEKEFVLPPSIKFRINSAKIMKQVAKKVDDEGLTQEDYYAQLFDQPQKPFEYDLSNLANIKFGEGSEDFDINDIDYGKAATASLGSVGFDLPKLDLKAQMLRSGGIVQKFMEGGVAQRRLGYIDYDVIANPANEDVVSKGMQEVGVDVPRLYFDKLVEMAVKARKEQSLNKLRAIYGVAGAGKTTLARGQGTDKGTLRETTRFPILTPEDIQKATEVLLLSSTVSKDRLDTLFAPTDRTYTLSSTTPEEKAIIKAQRASRDVTGVGAEGRAPGSTTGVPKDTAVGEALLADRLGDRSVVLGRTESGRLRRKRGDELVEIVKKRIGMTWGGFAPMTAGHESILDAAAAMGISPQDFVFLVGANESIKLGDPSSYRTAVFNQDARVLLAKAGAGARGATVVPKAADFEVPLGVDISEPTGRRKVLLPGKGSTVFVADKTEQQTAKYKAAGYNVSNIERTGGISGTMVRDLIMSGNMAELQKVLSPGVYELISNNIGRIQNRANVLPDIVEQVKQSQGVKLAEVERAIKAVGISRIDQKKMEDPEYAAKVQVLEELRSQRDQIKKSSAFEPYRLLDKLAASQPEQYALDFSQSQIATSAPVRTVKDRAMAAVAAETSSVVSASSGDAGIGTGQSLLDNLATRLKTLGGESGLRALGVSIPPDLQRRVRTNLIKDGVLDTAIVTGLIEKAEAIKKRKQDEIDGTRHVAMAGLQPLDYSRDPEWELDDGRKYIATIRGFKSSYLQDIERFRDRQKAAALEFAKDTTATEALGLLGQKTVQGVPRSLAIDFDDTLAFGTKMLDSSGKEDISAYYDEARVREVLSRATPTRLAQRLAEIEKDQPGTVRSYTRVLTARAESLKHLVTETLNRFGLPYTDSDITGVGQRGDNDRAIARKKGDNLSAIERFIDDSEKNISVAQQKGIQSYRYSEPKAFENASDYEPFGAGNIEGALLEQTLAMKMGRSIDFEALEQNRALDFPNGLGSAASLFGLPPNIETEVKRTLNKDSFTKARSEFNRYFKENPDKYNLGGLVSRFAQGGKADYYSLEKSSGLSSGEFDGMVRYAKTNDFSLDEFKAYLSKRAADKKSRVGSVIDPQSLQSFLMHGATGPRLGTGDLTDEQKKLAEMLKGPPDPQYDPGRFAGGGTVPALVSNGEAYVPPKLAKSIGYGKLNRMNQADRNGMGRFSDGGISVFKGPGTGTSDSIPTNLPVGSFIIREKATKALGLAKGGGVGAIQSFRFGGDVDYRPDVVTSSTAPIINETTEALQILAQTLRALGSTSSKASEIINSGRITNYKSAIDAAQADINRAKLMGASIQQISDAEKALQNIRNQATKSVQTRRSLQQISETDQARISAATVSPNFEAGVQRRISAAEQKRKQLADQAYAKTLADTGSEKKARQARDKISVSLSDEEQNKIREREYLKTVASKTGISTRDLRKQGLSSDIIQKYMAETALDPKTAKRFNTEYLKARQQDLQNTLNIATGSNYTAAEAKKLAQQELADRAKMAKEVRKSQGLGTRLSDFASKSNVGLSLALPVITDLFAGGEATSAAGAATQAATQGVASSVSSSLALASLGGPAGLAAGAVTLISGLAKTFAEAQNAVVDFTNKLSRSKIEEATERLSRAFDKLSKDVKNAAILGDIERDLKAITVESNQLMNSNITDIRYGLLNLFESSGSPEGFERSRILQNQGVTAYISSILGGDETRQRLFSREEPLLAKENAKLFTAASEQTQRYIQALVEAGKTQTDLISDPAFMSIAQNLALADASIQRALADIDDPAQKAQFLKDVTQTRAAEFIEISFRAKELKDLNTATKELSLSFNRLFDTMDQSINAVNYGLKQFADNLSASVDSLSGSGPKIQAADLQSINILQNPLAYSKQEFNQATQVGSSLFGNDATLVNSLLKLGPSLEDSLLSTINNILKTSGDQPEIAKGRVNREVRDQLSNLGLPADLASKLAREIGKAVGDIADETDKGAISLQELTEKISGLGDILETSKKANASVTNALKYWQDALNSYSDQTNKAAELQVTAAAKLRRANDILFESTLSLASALGKDIDLSFIERSLNNTIAQRTGGLTDPVAITNALFDLERRRSTQQANLAATQSNVGGVGAEAAIIKTTKELSQTNVQIAETRAALEDLANNSELASAALNKIQQAQQKQAGRVSFIEKLVTSTPEQLKSLNNAFANLQRYASGQTQSIQQSTAAQKAYREALKGGATRREAQKAAQEAFAGQRSDALSLLNDISPFLGSGQQANNIRASALETMLRESGIGINPMMQQVLNAVRNPEADPETKAAIETYKSAIRTQAEANKQLARINSSLAADIAQSTAKAIKEALSAVTLKFDDKAMQDLADSIRTLKPAQARADGGIIYASQGSFVNFAPKGTDTVPAMLTPGEFVVNRTATQQNRPLLEAINNGYAKGGKVRYYAAGGYVAGSAPGGDDVFKGAFDNTKLTPDKYAEPKSLSSQPYEAYTNLGYGVDLGSDNSSFIKFRSDNLEFQIGNNAADSLKNNEKATLSLSSLQQGVLFTNIGLSRSKQNPVSAATIEYTWNGSDGSASIKNPAYLSTPTVYGALLYDTPNSTAKQLEEADIPGLIRQYDSALNNMFRIEERGEVYNVQQPISVGNTSFTIPKVFSQTLSNAPEAELSASQGYFIDSAMLRLSNIGEPFGQANYGIGFVNTSFSPNTGPQFSTDSSPTSDTYKIGAGGNLGIGSISNNNSIRSAIPNAVSNVAEYLDKIRNIKDKKESLENIVANPSLLQYSDESQQTQQIWDKLNKIFSSNSVYISELFDVTDGLNFELLGGKKTNTTVYGGKASDFDSLFKKTIQDQIDGGKTNIQSSVLAGSKPINIKPDNPAISSKSFAWTQGISLSELDPNAPQKTAEAEQALAQIITSEQNKRGKFTIPLNIDGKITNTNIPYDLLYQKVDGKLWNSNTSAYSGKKISQISGGPLYALGASFNSNIQPAGSVFDGLTLSNANDLLAVSSRGFNNDALINSAALVKDQFNKPAVKKYLEEALKANKYDISLLSSAKSATRTRISGNKTGSGLFNFVKSINGTFEDFSDPTNTIAVQTGADIEFGKYLETVAKQLISDKASAAAISSTTAFKPSDFTSTLSDPALLGPAFETIGKTAYELFGQGGPYQYGNFGINLGGVDPKKLTREQIRQASSALSAQLTNMLTALDQEMNDPAANPALFDLYNNGQVLMSGALKALSGLANADTNLITRYLNPTDLRMPNFNWLALKDNALTMFRAFGAISSGRLSGFLNQTLTPDDQIDLQSILGNKDKFKTVDKTGKVGDDAALPQLSTINDVLKLALNPYNQFDETTDRSILLNALQARLINAKDGQGRSVFSRQMMLYTLDNLEALRVWFGGEPGANIKFANPPTGFDADGLPIASGPSSPPATPTAPTTLAGALATGLSNLANAAINTVSGAASNVASAVGLGGLAGMFGMKTNTWSGIDYLYDQTPPTPDWATRLQALRDGFDSTLYDNAAKAFAELGAITEFGTLPSLDYYAGLPAVQYKQTGGMIYASRGQLVNFEPKGTDTVPAMLTPGEFVVNRQATQKNLPLLKAINSGVGGYSIGGVVYAADGAQVPRGSNVRVRNRNKSIEESPLISGLAAGATEYGAGVLDTAGALVGGALPALLSAPVAVGEQLANLIYGNTIGTPSGFATDVFRSSLGNLQKPSERINKGLVSAGVYDKEILDRPGSYLSGASTEQLTQQLSPEAQLTALGLDFASPDAGDVAKIPGAATKFADLGLMSFFFGKKSTGFMGMEKTIDYSKPTAKGAVVTAGLLGTAGYLLNTYLKEMFIQPSVSKEDQEATAKSNAETEAQRANIRKALGLSSGGLVYLAEGGMAAVRDDVRNLRTTFNQLDKDKNSLLTADEYEQRQDWNKDGGVDWSEFSRPESLATAAFAGMASMFGAADLVPAFPQDVDPDKQRQVDRTQKVAGKRSRDRAAKADMSARQQAFATQTAAKQAFQRARTRALNEGQTIAEANNAGMQAQQKFMTQAASDPSMLNADKRDSQLEFRSNARAQTLAKKEADKAFDDALAAGKTEDEAYDAYQQTFDREKKKPGLMTDARNQVTKEQADREARKNQLYTIDDVGKAADTDWADRASGSVNGQPAMRLSDMTGPERNAIRAKRAAEKKQQEKNRRQSEIDAAIKAKREQEAIERDKTIAQENRDRVLGVDRELNTGKYGSTYAEKDKRKNEARASIIAKRYTFSSQPNADGQKYSVTGEISEVDFSGDPPTVVFQKIDPKTGMPLTRTNAQGEQENVYTKPVPLDRLDPTSQQLVRTETKTNRDLVNRTYGDKVYSSLEDRNAVKAEADEAWKNGQLDELEKRSDDRQRARDEAKKSGDTATYADILRSQNIPEDTIAQVVGSLDEELQRKQQRQTTQDRENLQAKVNAFAEKEARRFARENRELAIADRKRQEDEAFVALQLSLAEEDRYAELREKARRKKIKPLSNEDLELAQMERDRGVKLIDDGGQFASQNAHKKIENTRREAMSAQQIATEDRTRRLRFEEARRQKGLDGTAVAEIVGGFVTGALESGPAQVAMGIGQTLRYGVQNTLVGGTNLAARGLRVLPGLRGPGMDEFIASTDTLLDAGSKGVAEGILRTIGGGERISRDVMGATGMAQSLPSRTIMNDVEELNAEKMALQQQYTTGTDSLTQGIFSGADIAADFVFDPFLTSGFGRAATRPLRSGSAQFDNLGIAMRPPGVSPTPGKMGLMRIADELPSIDTGFQADNLPNINLNIPRLTQNQKIGKWLLENGKDVGLTRQQIDEAFELARMTGETEYVNELVSTVAKQRAMKQVELNKQLQQSILDSEAIQSAMDSFDAIRSGAPAMSSRMRMNLELGSFDARQALGDTAPTNLPRSQAANSTRQSLIQRGREKAIAQWIQDNTPMTSNTETLPIPTNQTPSNLVNSSQGATNSSGLPASLDTRTKYEKWADIYDPNADIWDPLRTEAIKNPEFAKVLKQRRGYSNGGIVYANNGALIAAQSYGSDTVPAMLTPGEFVINRNATQQHKPLLEAINSGQYTTGGIVRYLAAGGYITPQRLQNGSMEPIKNAQNIRSNGGVNTSVSTEQPSWVSDFMNSISALGPMLSSVGAAFTKSATELASNIPSDGITIQSDVNVTGSVGLASDTLGRAVNMGAQQGMQYTDQTQLAANQKMMRETDGGISFA